MKLNITKGLILIGALALGSCSTQSKLASNYDDVYNSKAKAGDAQVYAQSTNNYRHDNGTTTTATDYGDDYYTYDSYSARLNRFYDTPYSLSYYDNLNYGGSVNPYYSALGFSLGGFGYGYGSSYFGSPYGYSPYSYGYNNPYYGGYYSSYYNVYGPYSSLYGGGYGSAGVYSYYNTVGGYAASARPYRGTTLPAASPYAGTTGSIYYAPNPVTARPQRTVSLPPSGGNNQQPVIQQVTRPQVQPSYQPQPQQSNPSSSSSGSSNSGGGGGARPVRP